MTSSHTTELTNFFWSSLQGESSYLSKLSFTGPEFVLPSVFDVTALATSTVGVATLAALELKQKRLNDNIELKAAVDSRHASGSFRSDFKPVGWELPPIWDPFAGDYKTKNGWIRLHTNYQYHRDAVFSVVGVCNNKIELQEKVINFDGADLELKVVEAGGCAAVMYSEDEWRNHPHGSKVLNESMISLLQSHSGINILESITSHDSPLKGVRVLDLTRVIAGPTCTKFLSAHGAHVLRIDPPGFQEVPALVPETSVGKKRAFLNLKTPEGKKIFDILVKEAHVLVHGLRPDALEKLGIDDESLKILNPNLIIASLNAYGNTGPWKNRRGFDSLVQMSSGITSAGALYKKADRPIPLPVQALDFSVGYLLAAGVCRALSELYQNNNVYRIKASLIGASNILKKYKGNFDFENPKEDFYQAYMIKEKTFWGEAFRMQCPGTINGQTPEWKIPSGPFGSDTPAF